MRLAALMLLAFVAPAAPAQLFAVTGGGVLYRLDPATGAATLVGASGAGCNAAAAHAGHIYTMTSASALARLDPATGALAASTTLSTAGVVGYGPRGLAIDGSGTFWVVMSRADTTEIDILARLNLPAGTYTVVGPTGRPDLQALAVDASGQLFALGVLAGGALYRLNSSTGAATLVGPASLAGDDQALEFDGAGTLYAARENLRRVNVGSGSSVVIGAMLPAADVRGLAWLPEAGPECCVDYNQDEELDFSDIEGFLVAYNAQVPGSCAPGADLNGDEEFDFSDIERFLALYNAGC